MKVLLLIFALLNGCSYRVDKLEQKIYRLDMQIDYVRFELEWQHCIMRRNLCILKQPKNKSQCRKKLEQCAKDVTSLWLTVKSAKTK